MRALDPSEWESRPPETLKMIRCLLLSGPHASDECLAHDFCRALDKVGRKNSPDSSRLIAISRSTSPRGRSRSSSTTPRTRSAPQSPPLRRWQEINSFMEMSPPRPRRPMPMTRLTSTGWEVLTMKVITTVKGNQSPRPSPKAPFNRRYLKTRESGQGFLHNGT